MHHVCLILVFFVTILGRPAPRALIKDQREKLFVLYAGLSLRGSALILSLRRVGHVQHV